MKTNLKHQSFTAEIESSIKFEDLFDLEEIQHLQDLFAEAHGVASLITLPDGTPVTRPSCFTRLCKDIIRNTDQGCQNCIKSDAVLGRHNPQGPVVQLCLSGGLWDAGSSITVGGKHIANWLIGQVRCEELDEQQIERHALEIGANKADFKEAYGEVPIMAVKKFKKVADLLFVFANEISVRAYHNFHLKKQVAERDQAINLMQVSEEKYRALFENVQDVFFQTDLNGILLEISPSIKYFSEFNRDELLGTSVYDLYFNSEDREHFLKSISKNGELSDYEIHLKTKTGEKRYASINARLVTDPDGRPVLITGALREITERKRNEQAMRESEEKYRILFVSNPQPMWIFDLETLAFLEVNDAAIDHYGYSKEEFLSMTARDLRPEEDIPSFLNDFAQHKDTFKSDCVWRHVRKNGEIIFVEITSHPVLYKGKKARHVLVQDISARKQAEEALQMSEVRFRELYENAKIGLYRTTPDGKILLANKAFIKMLGYPSFEILEKRNLEKDGFEPSYQRSEFLKTIEKEGEINDFESVWTRQDGTSMIARESTRAIRDAKNNTLYFDGIVEDITLRKQVEEKLLFRNILLATQQEALIEGFLVVDEDNHIVSYNHRFMEMFGIPQELIDMREDEPLLRYTTEIMTDPQTFYSRIKYLYEHKNETSREEIVLKNGSIFDRYSAPMIGPENRYYGRIWSFHDITGFKQTEARLSVQTDAMEATIDGLAILDADQKFIYMNHSYARIHGYDDAGELIGSSWQILYSSTELQRFGLEIAPAIRQKRHYQGRALGMKKDGSIFPMSLSLTALNNGGMISTIRDIFEQVAAEQELIHAKEKAVESDRLKSAFLANMSHEVRTPLNSIIGFSELLADNYFEEDQKNEFIQSIIISGNSLLSIINDIMDISKLESGEMTIRKTKLNIRDFISGVKEQFSFQAETKNIGFKLLLPETDEETYINADPGRLMQIFNNLIGNALKFTEEGAIEISYQPLDNNVEFQVRDSGIGIAQEYHHKIFDRFRQVETANTRKFGGNGLGLAITKNLVELMDGKIWLESEPGKGSVFYFTMPVFISL